MVGRKVLKKQGCIGRSVRSAFFFLYLPLFFYSVPLPLSFFHSVSLLLFLSFCLSYHSFFHFVSLTLFLSFILSLFPSFFLSFCLSSALSFILSLLPSFFISPSNFLSLSFFLSFFLSFYLLSISLPLLHFHWIVNKFFSDVINHQSK